MSKVSKLISDSSNKNLKRIELCNYIDSDLPANNISAGVLPYKKDDNIKLISVGSYYDIIAVWRDGADENGVCVYLGHWNDGVI